MIDADPDDGINESVTVLVDTDIFVRELGAVGKVVTDELDEAVDVPKLLIVVSAKVYAVFGANPPTNMVLEGYDDDP